MSQRAGQESVRSTDGTGAIVATISRQIVALYVEYHGRGPTKAKTMWRDGIVTCLLEEVFSRSERVLVDGGQFDQVRRHREALHEALEPLLRNAIEVTTGHRVEACLGQTSADGVAVEVFVLGDRLPVPMTPNPHL
jgi:uncharacterized protein YbcI